MDLQSVTTISFFNTLSRPFTHYLLDSLRNKFKKEGSEIQQTKKDGLEGRDLVNEDWPICIQYYFHYFCCF